MPTTTPEEPAVILEDGKIIHTEEINLAIDDSFIPDTRELLLNSSTGIEPVDSKLRGPYNNYCLQDYAYWAGIYSFETIDEAIEAATQIYPECGGITLEASNEYTLRRGTELIASDNGETSWILKDPFGSDAPVETQRSDQENTESSAVVSALSTENDVEVPRVMLVDTVGFDDSATNTVPVVLTNHTQEESKEGDGGDNSDGGGDGDDDDEEREQNSEESFFCDFNLFDNSDEDSDENSCRNHNDSNNNSKLVCAKCKKGLSLKPPNTWSK